MTLRRILVAFAFTSLSFGCSQPTDPGIPPVVMADAGLAMPYQPMQPAQPMQPMQPNTGCEVYTGNQSACLAQGQTCGFCFDDSSCRSAPNYGEFGNCVNWQWGQVQEPPPPAPSAECQSNLDCGAGRACVGGVCVGTGQLRFTLRWHVETDADLHVKTPAGTEIYFGNTVADSGELDVDNIQGGPNSVENVFFTAPASGTYEFWVVNFNGRAAASYDLEVFRGDQMLATHPGSLPAEARMESPRHIVSF